jgi:hypothetical protein
MEFTDRFQAVANSYPDNIQLHAAAILVINDYLRRTNQSVSDNLKIELALFAFGTSGFLEVLKSRFQLAYS